MRRLRDLASRLRRSVAFTLFLAAFGTSAYFYQGGGQNESARFDSIRAYVDFGTLIIDRFIYNSADIIRVGEHYYSSKAPGTFFLGLPIFAVAEPVLRAIGVNDQIRYHWVCYLVTVFTISLLSALIVALLYRIGLRLNLTRSDAAIGSLAIGFGTILMPFSTLFFSHAATATALVFAFYQFFAIRQSEAGEDIRGRLLGAGFALGFGITLEYPAAIGGVLIGLYALPDLIRRRPVEKFGWIALGVFVGILPQLIYNLHAFGHPFYISYEAYAQESNPSFAAHKKGVLGIQLPFFDRHLWPMFLNNLAEITYRPLRGIFFANPVLWLTFPGFVLLATKRWRLRYKWTRESLLAVAIWLAYLTMNAGFGDSIVYWGGGASFGPRHLIPALPFLAIPLFACLRQAWMRAAVAPLAMLSSFICLMAMAIEPRTPYQPGNPIFYLYLPNFVTGRLATNTGGVFSKEFMTYDSVAFNFGKLFDLPIQLQLLPLYLFWLWMAYRLDRQLGIPERGFLFATGILVLIGLALPIGGLI